MKEKFNKTLDEVNLLQLKRDLLGLTEKEELSLRNLEVKLMQYWSELKD